MKKGSKQHARNREIVTFFYMIFGNRIRKGMNPDDARREAYDAVALRYDISRGRLLNIISEQKISHKVNDTSLQQNAIALIADLMAVNDGLDAAKDKNTRLIGLLKECLENDIRP